MRNKNIGNIVKISIYLIVLLFMTSVIMGKVYANCKCNVDLSISQKNLKKGEKFTADISLSDIQSEMGVMVFGATIDYDKTSLSIEKMEGLNDWESPSKGASYNEENGKIIITKNGFAKGNEAILRITFNVLEESKKNLTVALKEVSASDGTGLAEINEVSKDITVKNGARNSKNGKKKGISPIIITVIVIIGAFVVIKFSNKNKSHKRK